VSGPVHGRTTGGLLVALLACGCQPAMTCPESGTACGGDPTGTWNVAQACRDPTFTPPVPVTYLGQPIQMARQPGPMMTSSDWCSSLVLGSSGITAFTFPHDTLSLSGGQLTYVGGDDPDPLRRQTYQAVINTSGPGGIDLSHACLDRTGMIPSCDAVAAALTTFAATRPQDPGVPCTDSLSEPSLCQFYYSYQDIRCQGGASGGCRCTYTVSFTGKFGGRWQNDGGLLTHSDASKMLPSEADYCVAGATMSLWGHARTSILGMAGLRTLTLDRCASTCGNGMVECAEQCDPPDQTTCDPMCRTILAP
jgi:hypothetical protein